MGWARRYHLKWGNPDKNANMVCILLNVDLACNYLSSYNIPTEVRYRIRNKEWWLYRKSIKQWRV